MSPAQLAATLRAQVDEGPGTLLVGTMAMIVVVLNTSHDPPLFVGAIGAFVIGLLIPRVLTRSWWWIAIAAIFGMRVLSAWEGVDNHVILTVYLTLAVGLGLATEDPIDAIARSGRLLVGFVFLFATAWKVASPDFRSGAFFEFTLLLDERFRLLVTTVGGLSPADHQANVAALAEVGTAEMAPVTVPLISSDAITLMAAVLAAGTILVEGAVAGAYLAPLAPSTRWVRPIVLLAFCVLTYVIVPVGGFGLALVVMTIADPAIGRRWRRALVVLFGSLLLYGPLWQAIAG